MPPRRYVKPRTRGYTRRYSGYSRKPRYSGARRTGYGKSYKARGSSYGMYRKYTRGAAVTGAKSVVPTTSASVKTRVEVKQVVSGPPAGSHLGHDNYLHVPQVNLDTDALALAAANVEANKFFRPIATLQPIDGNWSIPGFASAAIPAIPEGEGGDPPAVAEVPAGVKFVRNLTHIGEGVGLAQRVGRIVHINQINIMLNAVSLIANDLVPGSYDNQIGELQRPARRPTEWHLFVIQEYQQNTNDSHLSIENFMRTMYDADSCHDIESLMLAPPNRYTASSYGKILLRRKIVVDGKKQAITRKYNLKFPRPIEVRYKGNSGHAVAENRISCYLFPVAPVPNNKLVNTFGYSMAGVGEGAMDVTKWGFDFVFVPSVCNYTATTYFTDA